MSTQETDIAELVFELVRMVPKGRVSTYGAIARAVGLASGARLVGRLMGLTKSVAPKVPAHRIVNSSGLLSGKFHFGPGKEMQHLLEREGISIVNDRVRDFNKLFWDPMKELS
jgi:methylated-DNA-protein-cysteine methyltransferase-like protein